MRQEIFSGKVVKLSILDGFWEVVEHADAVAVLVARGSEVLGVRQYRHAVGRESWEIPAGLIDPGEEPITAAARELAEEAQLGGNLTLVTRFYPSPGFSDEETYLYELHEMTDAPGKPDETEQLQLEWRDALETWRAVAAGELATSSVTVVALRQLLARRGVSV